MKLLASRVLAAAALLLAAEPATAENGLRRIGVGPVQRSMGGAAAAAPLDVATIVANPAGLAALGTRADAAITWLRSTAEYTADGTSVGSEPVQALVPSLGVVRAVGERLSLGVGLFGVSHLAADYPPSQFFGLRSRSSYSDLRLAPAAAWKFDDRLSVGLALNLARATMGYTSPAVAVTLSRYPREGTSALGVGATLGLAWSPAAALTLGFAWESRTYLQPFEWSLPDHPISADGSLVGGTERLSFDQPQIFTVGAAYRLQSLFLAADVAWIDWSSTHGRDLPAYSTDPAATGGLRWDMGWSDQVVVKAGAQWAATDALRIRAGYAWGRSPLDPNRALENITFNAAAERHVTVGAGYSVGPATVDLAFVWSPKAAVSGSIPEEGVALYDASTSQLALDLGVGYAF